MPIKPTVSPMAVRNRLSSTIDRQIITAPSDGNVSSPENGGAIKANAIKIIRSTAIARDTKAIWKLELCLGLNLFSNQEIKSISFGIAVLSIVLPGRTFLNFFGCIICLRPISIWAAKIIAITSNTWVTPPVGIGKAGTAISINMATAKLFSAKASFRLSNVLFEDPSSQWRNF